MRNTSIVAFLFLLLSGCGGGSGTDTDEPNGPAPPGPNPPGPGQVLDTAYVVGANRSLIEINLPGRTSRAVSRAFGMPQAVAVAPNGQTVYVIDADTDQLSAIELSSSRVRSIGTYPNVADVAVGPTGTLYLAARRRILRVDPMNGVAEPIVESRTNVVRVVVNAQETEAYAVDLTSAENNVLRINFATRAISTLARFPFLADFPPLGFALAPNETYLALHSFSDSTIRRIALSDGAISTTPIKTACFASAINGAIAFDGADTVLVTDSADCLTRVNLSTGVNTARGNGADYGEPGVFLGAYGIAID